VFLEGTDVTHLFPKRYFEELIDFGSEANRYGKSAIIDTNYLIQINLQDLISMLFETNYEARISNPRKKQMARLFRSMIRKEIALFFSNSMMREFLYVSPDKIDLIRQYTKYLCRVGSKRQLEPFFLDLASLLNVRAKMRGHRVDLLDTYSYVISNLAGIDFFVSEDGDVKGIFEYVNEIKNTDRLSKIREIGRLMKLNEILFNIEEGDFPLKRIIERLFLYHGRLTIPINIREITEDLPKASEKADSIVIFCETINEIEDYKEMIASGNAGLLLEARELVNSIFQSVQCEPVEPGKRIDVDNLYVDLIEKDGLWEKPEGLDEKHSALHQILQDIQERLYSQEEEGEYEDLEAFFNSALYEFEVEARCPCGHEFRTGIHYGGVVARENREMGPESLHVWNNEIDCPKCGKFLEIELELWEYPIGFLNNIDFDSYAEILNEYEIYHAIGIIPESS